MSVTGSQSLVVTMPDQKIGFLDGNVSPVNLAWWRTLQALVRIANSIPDTAVVAELMAEIAALTLQVEAAQTEAAQAAQQAALALSQSDPTLGYLALARLDGSAA